MASASLAFFEEKWDLYVPADIAIAVSVFCGILEFIKFFFIFMGAKIINKHCCCRFENQSRLFIAMTATAFGNNSKKIELKLFWFLNCGSWFPEYFSKCSSSMERPESHFINL